MNRIFKKIRDAWFWEFNHTFQATISDLKKVLIDAEIDRLLSHPKYLDKSRLEPFGYKVYSQSDEDGIIHEIFKRIGTINKKFIEFGVGNGFENNTHFLLLQGWSGLWIEGEVELCEKISRSFRKVIESGRLTVKNSYVSKENINDLFLEENFRGEIDLLSIDIDGNDYHIFDTINVINPRVIIIEYNAKFPPFLEWYMEYNSHHVWDGSDNHGASLKSLEILGAKKGYQLVGTNLTGINAFFVRRDLVKDLFSHPPTAENLYNPPRWEINYEKKGHPPKIYLGLNI